MVWILSVKGRYAGIQAPNRQTVPTRVSESENLQHGDWIVVPTLSKSTWKEQAIKVLGKRHIQGKIYISTICHSGLSTEPDINILSFDMFFSTCRQYFMMSINLFFYYSHSAWVIHFFNWSMGIFECLACSYIHSFIMNLLTAYCRLGTMWSLGMMCHLKIGKVSVFMVFIDFRETC